MRMRLALMLHCPPYEKRTRPFCANKEGDYRTRVVTRKNVRSMASMPGCGWHPAERGLRPVSKALKGVERVASAGRAEGRGGSGAEENGTRAPVQCRFTGSGAT